MFCRAILKNCNRRPRYRLTVKFGTETKILKLGPKMSNLGVFGPKFENTIAIIEISAPEIVLFQSLVSK